MRTTITASTIFVALTTVGITPIAGQPQWAERALDEAELTGALAERLVALPTGKAFHAYQQDLQTTVFDVQDRTRRMARWYVPCSIWRQALRDAAMWLLPTAYFENHFKAKYSRA